jgi:hypothetical protein
VLPSKKNGGLEMLYQPNKSVREQIRLLLNDTEKMCVFLREFEKASRPEHTMRDKAKGWEFQVNQSQKSTEKLTRKRRGHKCSTHQHSSKHSDA